MAGHDLVVDGTDNFPTRYLLNDAAVITNIPYVYGSIFRFEGQVSVFNYKEGPNYRDLFPEPPSPELVPNCSEGGVLGVLPGIIGSIQALETIKLITGIGEVLSGKLLTIDTLSNQYRTFKFKKRADRKKITALIDYEEFCAAKEETSSTESISPKELEEWRTQERDFQLVDVRESYEYEISNINGKLFPKSRIKEFIGQIKRDVPVVVHCRSGQRSSEVIKFLEKEHDFDNLLNLDGGILRYIEEVDSSLTVY